MTTENRLVQLGVWDIAAQEIAGGTVLSTGLSAAGATQATATAITADISVFGTVASGTGAILPGTNGASRYVVRNGGANALLVYAPVGGTMNGTLNGSVSVAASTNAMLISTNGVDYYSLVSA
jgi:hypothetical protein